MCQACMLGPEGAAATGPAGIARAWGRYSHPPLVWHPDAKQANPITYKRTRPGRFPSSRAALVCQPSPRACSFSGAPLAGAARPRLSGLDGYAEIPQSLTGGFWCTLVDNPTRLPAFGGVALGRLVSRGVHFWSWPLSTLCTSPATARGLLTIFAWVVDSSCACPPRSCSRTIPG